MTSSLPVDALSSLPQPADSTEKQREFGLWNNFTMDFEPQDVPPSYDSIDDDKTASEITLQAFQLSFREFTLPPKANYLVRSNSAPSPWELLAGPAMSNVITPENTEPLRKRRYRVVYPPSYEDVYLHKSTWSNNTSTLPRYHVEIYGKDRYEPEPIVILGPADHESTVTNEARNLAACYVERVISRMESEISKTTRFADFCEREYFSWDWTCKTTGAKQDMRTLIIKAKGECLKCMELLAKLEKYLEFVGEEDARAEMCSSLKRSIRESSAGLAWLRL